jgi:hypothetical protein
VYRCGIWLLRINVLSLSYLFFPVICSKWTGCIFSLSLYLFLLFSIVHNFIFRLLNVHDVILGHKPYIYQIDMDDLNRAGLCARPELINRNRYHYCTYSMFTYIPVRLSVHTWFTRYTHTRHHLYSLKNFNGLSLVWIAHQFCGCPSALGWSAS